MRIVFLPDYLLVVVDSNLRFLRGGGDSDPSSLDAPILTASSMFEKRCVHVRKKAPYNSTDDMSCDQEVFVLSVCETKEENLRSILSATT